jgi:hypothetical protein
MGLKGSAMTIWRALQLFGLACLVVVVLTHVTEHFKVFTSMGWGQPASLGHSLDLMSAVLGCTLLALGLAGSARNAPRANCWALRGIRWTSESKPSSETR